MTMLKTILRLAVLSVGVNVLTGSLAYAQTSGVCLTLQETLLRNARLDPAIGQALAEQEISDAQLDQVKSDWRPQLSAYGRTAQGEEGLVDGQTDNQVGLILSQRIYDFGQGKYEKEAARARLQASEISIGSAENSSAQFAAQSYLAVLKAYERVESAKTRSGYMVTLTEGLDRRLEVNLITLAELSAAKAERALAKSNLIEEELSLAASQARLKVLTQSNDPVCAGLTSVDALISAAMPDNGDEALSAAFADNPDLRASAAKDRAVQAELSASKRSQLPVINLQGVAAYIHDDFTDSFDTSTRIGLDVSVPLYGSGRYSGEKRAAASRLKSSQMNTARLRRELEQNVSLAWQRALSYEALAGSQADMRDNLRSQAQALTREFDQGLRTYQDVLRVESDLQMSVLREIDARYQAREQKIRVLSLTNRLQTQL